MTDSFEHRQPKVADAGLGQAIGISARIFPYAGVRLLRLMALTSAFAFGLILTLAIAAVLKLHVNQIAAGVVVAIGVGALVVGVLLADKMLFLDHAGHVAVIMSEVSGSPLPDMGSLYRSGRSAAEARFRGGEWDAEASLARINSTIREVEREMNWLTGWLPFEVDAINSAASWFMRTGHLYVRDITLSYMLFYPGDPDDRADDALVMTAEHASDLGATLLRLVATERVLGFFSWVVLLGIWCTVGYLGAAHGLGALLIDETTRNPDNARLVLGIGGAILIGVPFAAMGVWVLKHTIIRPVLSLICLSRFHRWIVGKRPDPAMRQRMRDGQRLLDRIGSERVFSGD